MNAIDSISDKLDKLTTTKHWHDAENPNLTAKCNTMILISKIRVSHDILPGCVVCSIVNGVCLQYPNINNKSLVFETYNTGEIGCIVCDVKLKKIIYSEDILWYNIKKAMLHFLK